MKSVELTREAKEDLRKIARYTEKHWGREQRYLYIRQFDDVFHLLTETPTLGKECDFIKKAYRKFPQGSHMIFYRIYNHNILIVRILHKNMDVDSKFVTP